MCSQNLRAKRAETINAALRGLGGKWQMLTITLRHRRGMQLGPANRDRHPKGAWGWCRKTDPAKPVLYDAMMRAWRRARQGGAKYLRSGKVNPRRGVQALWERYVSGSVRAVEIPYGENGWHPHLHVLIRTETWSRADKFILLNRWKRAIRAELGPACTPSDERAIVWSRPIDAAHPRGRAEYLAKLGLELASPSHKRTRGASHWALAERGAAGDPQAVRLWEEFYRGTRGHRMIELDDRAAAAARRQLDEDRMTLEASAIARESDALPPPTPPQSIEVKRDDVRALRALERRIPNIFSLLLTVAENDGVSGVAHWIAYARAHDSSSPGP